MPQNITHAIKVICLAASAWLISTQVHAGSLYLPASLSPEIEARIERLFVSANMAIIKRPIPVKQVQIALERAESVEPLLVSSIRRYLERYSHRASITHFSIEGSVNEGATTTAENQRGLDTNSDYLVSGSAYWAISDHIAVSIGGIAGERESGLKDEFPEGTFLSLGWDYLQADIGYRSHWWGPSLHSDMLLSTQASAMPGVTLSNVVPLPWLGIQYELFAAQMSKTDSIRSGDNPDERLEGNPILAGVHLSLSPVDGFAIGFNRLMQFGGADRDKSFSGFFNAFFNVKESENIGAEKSDFGNQVSSITTRYTFAGKRPISIYMEYAGEDTSASSDVHLGNTSLMYGVHLPKLPLYFDLTWESAEWQNSWYTNGNYGDGLTQYGSITGHWGAAYRDNAVGASAQTLKLNWDPLNGHALSLKYQTLENKDYSAIEYQKAEKLTLEYARGLGKFIGGLTVSTGNDVHGESFNNISGFIRW